MDLQWGGQPPRRRALGLMALATTACTESATETTPLRLRVGVERDYGPFVFVDERGELRGLSVDILRAIAPRVGLQLEWQPAAPLNQLLRRAERGELDLLTSLRATPERARYLGFGPPYVEVPAALLLRPGSSAALAGLSALAGRKVGVGKGYAVEAYVRTHFPAVQWEACNDDAEAVRRWVAGELEGVVADIASIEHVRRSLGLTSDRLQLRADLGFGYALSFAYPKDRVEIGARLAQGQSLLETEAQRAILQRWLPPGEVEAAVRQPTRDSLRVWGLGALGLAGLAGLALLGRRRRADGAAR
ncbi:ABC-type amino acid transport substrate-binding protein [Inhella inkyongensis]|uniref:ABC-type amino acid transport substrate-binding protein n=1 Tax=Inhella inkyongensis TaxID=392593 RepID=A0A840SA89_9BURK|nr:transporter substrate-binding domain-containing protein [Inhella inkyongensis]MBB5205926.1 ABC-type amino acid transport substrate-binding protein [Inhella inkyongensis]